MLFAFLDESYDRLNYHMAAVVLPLGSVPLLDRGLAAALSYASTAHGVAAEAELHAYEIMSGAGHWEPLRGKFRAASSVYQRALSAINASGAKVFIRGVNVPRLNARYTYPDPPHQVTLQHLLEQVDIYAKRSDERVVVVADECPDQARHAQVMEMYSRVGTPGYRRTLLESIHHPVLFGPSKALKGLQAADLVAYLYRRRFFHEHATPRQLSGVDRLWQTIAPAVKHRNHWVP